MSRLALAWFAAAATPIFLCAQTQPPITLEIRTEAARCDALARAGGTVCFRYTQPPSLETEGSLFPQFAAVRVTGPDTAAVLQAFVVSPGGLPWLRLRRPGASVGTVSFTDRLPQDLELYVDEAQARSMRAGRLLANLVVSVAGVSTPYKLPVQLTIGPETDTITAEPDFLADLTVNATPNPQPLRYAIVVKRNGGVPPFPVSVTPETSDWGYWLNTDLQTGVSPCSTRPPPCQFDGILTPPSQPGDYWGAWAISGEGYADRVAVRIRVNPPIGEAPPSIEPRQVSFSAPLGATAPLSTVVFLRGGYDGLAFRAVASDAWLTIEPTAARWPAALKLTANPSGLEAGLYTQNVFLRAVDTGELLATIPVTLAITAPQHVPTVLDGGGWRTTIYLVNPGNQAINATVRFWNAGRDNSASPWLLGLEGRGLSTLVENEVIPPLGLRVIETQGQQSTRQQGWAELVSDGAVAVHAVLSESRPGASARVPVDATLPLSNPFRDRLLLAFDQRDSASVSISLANPDDQPVNVTASVLNENGAEEVKDGKFMIPARGSATSVLATRWPSSAKRRGVLALDFEGGRLFASGLRSFDGGVHAYPAVARNEMGLDRAFALVNAGGGWQSTAYLTNASALSQSGLLRLLPAAPADQDFAAQSALPVPANGMLVWQPEANDDGRVRSGWASSLYPKQVGGFMLLRSTPPAAATAGGGSGRFEAAVPGHAGFYGRIAIPFDNRAGSATQIVLVNTSDEPTDIQTVLYDLAGRFPRFGETFILPAKGQLAVDSVDRWELGGQQGFLEFSSRQSFRLTGVGLRFRAGSPMAILPAYERR